MFSLVDNRVYNTAALFDMAWGGFVGNVSFRIEWCSVATARRARDRASQWMWQRFRTLRLLPFPSTESGT
eukprot:3909266-Amphidinium_carterae.1